MYHTGFRVLDSILPTSFGSTCVYPANEKHGKYMVPWALAKYSNTQCIINICCVESEKELYEIKDDFTAGCVL